MDVIDGGTQRVTHLLKNLSAPTASAEAAQHYVKLSRTAVI